MPDNIDKTRTEKTGERSFTGTGVDTIPDVMEENVDLRQQIQDMINEALANVTGATVIQDQPDQTTYNFSGGSTDLSEVWNILDQLWGDITDEFSSVWNSIFELKRTLFRQIYNLQQQINNLESGTGTSKLCQAKTAGIQTDLTSEASTLVEVDTAIYNPYSMLDTATYTITIPEDGNYIIYATVEFINTVVDKYYQIIIKDQDNTWRAHNYGYDSGVIPRWDCANVARFSAGNTLRLYVTQTAGIDTVDVNCHFFAAAKLP